MMKTISAAALAGVLFLTPACAIAETNTSETYRQLNLFGDVFERVRSEYVEPVTDEQLIETAINGMLTALDPHSSYLNRKSFQDMQVPDARRVRRPGHRSHDGERPDQGRLADRRHPRLPRRSSARRPDHPPGRGGDFRHEPRRRGREDARARGQRHQGHDPARRGGGAVRRRHHPRHHQDPVRPLPPGRRCRLYPGHHLQRTDPDRPGTGGRAAPEGSRRTS